MNSQRTNYVLTLDARISEAGLLMTSARVSCREVRKRLKTLKRQKDIKSFDRVISEELVTPNAVISAISTASFTCE